MNIIMKWLLTFVLCSLSVSAWSLSLKEAKQAKLVGETPSGYVAVVSSPADKALLTLVNDINKKRKALYQKEAQELGIDLKIVETRAGNLLIKKAKPGEYILNVESEWVLQ